MTWKDSEICTLKFNLRQCIIQNKKELKDSLWIAQKWLTNQLFSLAFLLSLKQLSFLPSDCFSLVKKGLWSSWSNYLPAQPMIDVHLPKCRKKLTGVDSHCFVRGCLLSLSVFGNGRCCFYQKCEGRLLITEK